MDTTTSPDREAIKIRPVAISDVDALRDLCLEALLNHSLHPTPHSNEQERCDLRT